MKQCLCGCGESVADHANYVVGHHWKTKRRRNGIPDSKVCEGCGATYARAQLESPQSNKHWLERKYCSDKCRRDALSTLDPSAESKECPRCGYTLPKTEFWKSSKSRDGLQSKCKDCIRELKKPLDPHVQRDRNLRNLYGIGVAEYDALLAAQRGVCAICGEAERFVNYRTGRPHLLAVDHCHETSRVRGLLCCACNQSLGKMRNRPDVLRAAAEYLERHERDYQQLRLQGD